MNTMNQSRKPQESLFASTKHDVVQSTSRKDDILEKMIKDINDILEKLRKDIDDILEKIRKVIEDILEEMKKMPTTDGIIQKSIFPDYEKDSTKPFDYGKLSKRSINQSRKPQESFLASTKHDVVQSRKAKTDDETFLDILERIRKTPKTDGVIQKSIFPDYEKDSTKPLDYGKLSKRSINQPRKPQESFLASTRHNVVQSTSRKNETDDETIWDICEKIKKMPTTVELIEKSIFGDFKKDSTTEPFDYEEYLSNVLSKRWTYRPRKRFVKRWIYRPRKPQKSFIFPDYEKDSTTK